MIDADEQGGGHHAHVEPEQDDPAEAVPLRERRIKYSIYGKRNYVSSLEDHAQAGGLRQEVLADDPDLHRDVK